jgi:hypothetical protein
VIDLASCRLSLPDTSTIRAEFIQNACESYLYRHRRSAGNLLSIPSSPWLPNGLLLSSRTDAFVSVPIVRNICPSPKSFELISFQIGATSSRLHQHVKNCSRSASWRIYLRLDLLSDVWFRFPVSSTSSSGFGFLGRS